MPTTSGFHLGAIRGTTIRVEVSFLMIVGLFVLFDLEGGIPLRVALLWIPILFISVLLHELGHATMIGAFGFGPSQIALSNFGGVTMNRRRAKPWQDFLISVAGPLTSFLIFAVTMGVLLLVPAGRMDPMLAALLPLLGKANLIWGIFNLVPLYPLDGGQAFRSFVLIFNRNERKATVISIVVSFLCGAALLGWSLLSRQLFLAVIVGILLMENYRRWQVYRVTAPPPPEP